jgi:hypothetical protein
MSVLSCTWVNSFIMTTLPKDSQKYTATSGKELRPPWHAPLLQSGLHKSVHRVSALLPGVPQEVQAKHGCWYHQHCVERLGVHVVDTPTKDLTYLNYLLTNLTSLLACFACLLAYCADDRFCNTYPSVPADDTKWTIALTWEIIMILKWAIPLSLANTPSSLDEFHNSDLVDYYELDDFSIYPPWARSRGEVQVPNTGLCLFTTCHRQLDLHQFRQMKSPPNSVIYQKSLLVHIPANEGCNDQRQR